MIDEAQALGSARVFRPKAAAEYLGVAVQTMARWRVEGRGPRYAKLGGAVVYSLRELDQFIERNTRGSTSEITAEASAATKDAS
jgi:hypothetical protein